MAKRRTSRSVSFCYIGAKAHSFRHLFNTKTTSTDRKSLKQAYSPIRIPSRETRRQPGSVFTDLARFSLVLLARNESKSSVAERL